MRKKFFALSFFQLVVCFILSFQLRADPPERVYIPGTIDQVFDTLYLNHSATDTSASRYGSKNFRRIVSAFFQVSHIQRELRKINRHPSRNYTFEDVTIFYSIYELEDPDIIRTLIAAYREGVSIVIITDRLNARPFEPAALEEIESWNDHQRAYYFGRFDRNHDGVVDENDVDEINYRTRLMKRNLQVLEEEISKIEGHRRQVFELVLSPHAHVPPKDHTYMPLHHSKIRMITVKGIRERVHTPIAALIGSNNDTFSGTQGDLREEVMDQLAHEEGRFFRRLSENDFVSASRGNVNMLFELHNQEILKFILEREILDSIASYKAGRMFLPATEDAHLPFREFTLHDGSYIRIGLSRGRPTNSYQQEDANRYDPNLWIANFLRNPQQEIKNIDEIIQSNFFFSHPIVLDALQDAMHRFDPDYFGVFDHSSSFQVYSSVPSLAGVTQLRRIRDDPQIMPSPYGMVTKGKQDIRIYTNPHDKMHLKQIMFKYEALDPNRVGHTQTRYRIFLGSLNLTRNGSNNREILFSIDTPSDKLYKILKGYVASVGTQKHAIPFKEAYTRHLIRSLFRLPTVRLPQSEAERAPWETALTKKRMQDIALAIEKNNFTKLVETIHEISYDLRKYSPFADSADVESALNLLRIMFFHVTDPAKGTEKHRWFFLDFVSRLHTDEFDVKDFLHISDYYLGNGAVALLDQLDRFSALAINHGEVRSALLRASLTPVEAHSETEAEVEYLMPRSRRRFNSFNEGTRQFIQYAFVKPNIKELLRTINSRPWRSSSVNTIVRKLISHITQLPTNFQHSKSKILYVMLQLFNKPAILADKDQTADALRTIFQMFELPDVKLETFEKIFHQYRKLAKASPNFPSIFCKKD